MKKNLKLFFFYFSFFLIFLYLINFFLSFQYDENKKRLSFIKKNNLKPDIRSKIDNL